MWSWAPYASHMFDASAPQHAAALARLAPYAVPIAGAARRHSAVSFVAETWREWLGEAGLEDVAGRVIGRFQDGTIDRENLRQVARDGSGDLDLLVATLIWGRGKSNGRMRPHIVAALRSDRRDEVLRETGRLAATGQPAAAYRAWSLPGLRAPFFTKWLWAASERGEPEVRPLILDARVWISLGDLGWSSLEAAGGSRRWPDRYAAYVESCHDWAAQLSDTGRDVSAEDIEYALFRANGPLDAELFLS